MRTFSIHVVSRLVPLGTILFTLLIALLIAPGCELLSHQDPEPAGERLADLLASDLPAEQIQGLRQLAQEPSSDDANNAELLQSARRLATDPNPKLRQAALITLAELHDDKALELIEAAIKTNDHDVRTTAFRALEILGDHDAQQILEQLASDKSTTVRSQAIRSLAEQKHFGHIRKAAGDPAWQVRLVVAEMLAGDSSPDVQQILEQLASDKSTTVRSQAIRSLAEQKHFGHVRKAADDPSWQVRLVVAEMLAGDSSPETTKIAERFLKSRNSRIQQQIVATLAEWPLRRAGPLLLLAIESDGYKTSKQAAEQLARRWPAASILPIDPARDTNRVELLAKRKQRAEAIDRLHQLWRSEFPPASEAIDGQIASSSTHVVSPKLTRRVQNLLHDLTTATPSGRSHAATLAELKAIGPELLDVLEQIAADPFQKPVPEVMFREVLPERSKIFTALDLLADESLSARRNGAAVIAKHRKRDTNLSTLELARLAQLLIRENDATIWRSLLPTIANDSRPAARHLILVSLGHPRSDIRRRGCEAVGNAALTAAVKTRYQSVLIPSLDDSSPSVIKAALDGLANTGPLDDRQPVIAFLRHSDKSIRLAAAITLAKLGGGEGRDALHRMALGRDPQLRRQTAAVMGQIGHRSFIPILLAMLDDRTPIQQAAFASLRQLTGQDFRHAQDGSPAGQATQVRSWRRWHSTRL